jgi:type IV secretory pathway ATPase VirB11/archaellum biosynthesis ATPase
MSEPTRLQIGDEGAGDAPDGRVPPPLPPDDPEAWYAPDVREQYAVHPGVVATVRERDTDGGPAFAYEVREPTLTAAGEAARERLDDYFADATLSPPRTREGAVERLRAWFGEKYAQALDRLTDLDAPAERRVTYYALRDHRCLGGLTPLALDDRIEVADRDGDRLRVHLDDYAPAATDLDPPAAAVRRFASERVARYTVEFLGTEVPVVLSAERVLGDDPFAVQYAVKEPELLPGDEELIAEAKERVWETGVDGVIDADDGSAWAGADGTADDRAAFVREQARTFLARRLSARNTRAWLAATRHRVRSALAAYDLAVPPAGDRYARDRLDDLTYYVLRDFVGQGILTVPIRDPHLEDVEANAVGERLKVVPRDDLHAGRVPTNLRFDSETEFVNVVTQLAADDGVELNAATPSAKVNLDPAGVDETIRCAVALPAISEDGPHVSIRKQAPDAMTPVDLLERDALPVDLVALLWLAYEHRGVVLFSGPTGVGKTTLMNAHMPFVAFDDRPISIDEGSREVRLPHETGVSLTTRDHESEFKSVTMAELMTEANYLNPDVEVIAEINTPASFETFGETLNTGHGVVGTTHAEDVEKLVNRVVEQGLPAYLLREIDLVVFPRRVDGERYVGRVVELLGSAPAGDDGPDDVETVRKRDDAVAYREVARRRPEGGFDVAAPGEMVFFERLAARTDRPVEDCVDEFERKRRYVEYFRRAGVDGFEDLFGLLSDLRTDEAATVERLAAAADGAAGEGPVTGAPDQSDRQGGVGEP